MKIDKATPGPWTDHNWAITGPTAADSHEARWAMDESARRSGQKPLYAVVAQAKPGHCVVATVHGETQAEVDANARLIAASPTMADYLRELAGAGDTRAAAILESIDAAR